MRSASWTNKALASARASSLRLKCSGITHGHSKDKRGDLKQFMMEAVCVKGSVTLLGAVLSGNTSDKKAERIEALGFI
jgi:transposase